MLSLHPLQLSAGLALLAFLHLTSHHELAHIVLAGIGRAGDLESFSSITIHILSFVWMQETCQSIQSISFLSFIAVVSLFFSSERMLSQIFHKVLQLSTNPSSPSQRACGSWMPGSKQGSYAVKKLFCILLCICVENMCVSNV
jgi:hypothetical protein